MRLICRRFLRLGPSLHALLSQVAVLSGGHGTPVKAVAHVRPYKTGCKVARLHNALHRIAGVKLHHSLNRVLYHPEFLPPHLQMTDHPADHPKLL